jgi:hypothetical protein
MHSYPANSDPQQGLTAILHQYSRWISGRGGLDVSAFVFHKDSGGQWERLLQVRHHPYEGFFGPIVHDGALENFTEAEERRKFGFCTATV